MSTPKQKPPIDAEYRLDVAIAALEHAVWELENADTTFRVLSTTDDLPEWLRLRMKEEVRRTRKAIKAATAVLEDTK